MFDIGFTELVIIGVVSLLVIGPERLPSAIRTGSLWLNRLKRGFTDIKREVEQELHNDAVLQELRKTGEDLKSDANSIGREMKSIAEPFTQPVLDQPELNPAVPTASASIDTGATNAITNDAADSTGDESDEQRPREPGNA
jgi:sec-independent protein translocase protein TatB